MICVIEDLSGETDSYREEFIRSIGEDSGLAHHFFYLRLRHEKTLNSYKNNAWALTRPPATYPCQYSCPIDLLTQIFHTSQTVQPWERWQTDRQTHTHTHTHRRDRFYTLDRWKWKFQLTHLLLLVLQIKPILQKRLSTERVNTHVTNLGQLFV